MVYSNRTNQHEPLLQSQDVDIAEENGRLNKVCLELECMVGIKFAYTVVSMKNRDRHHSGSTHNYGLTICTHNEVHDVMVLAITFHRSTRHLYRTSYLIHKSVHMSVGSKEGLLAHKLLWYSHQDFRSSHVAVSK